MTLTEGPRPGAGPGDSGEHHLRSVAQSVNDAVVSADRHGRIVFWNPAAEALLGYSSEEALRLELTAIMPERYHTAHLEGFARVLATGETRLIGRSSVELTARRRDGGEIDVELSLGMWEHAGNPHFTGVLRDISERRRAQGYVRAQLAVAEVISDNPARDRALTRLLHAVGSNLGWAVGGFWLREPADDVLRYRRFWAADDQGDPAALAEFERASLELRLERGVGLPGRVWELGAPVWMADAALDPHFARPDAAAAAGLHAGVGLPVVHAEEVIGVMEFFAPEVLPPDPGLEAMMKTISDQVGQFLAHKRADEALQGALSQLRERATALERSNAELEQFAYVASHDLSEPLRQVSGFVQLLARRYEGRLDADADKFIGLTVDGVRRMQEMIDDLLAYSRVGRSGRSDGPVDSGVAFAGAREALSAQIAERGATVEVDGLPTVLGDESELRQMFQNLLSNALKFCEQAPHVRVSAQRDGQWWRLYIDDNGIGVEPRHAERVFKMFQRLHARDSYPGTGIGLAIASKTVERLGGEITVGESPLGGSRFEVTLPVA